MGKITYHNGTYYEVLYCYIKGEFKNGLKHGKGIITYSDKEYYEGDFFEDMKQGNGTMHW